jgi:hypothetical protein
VTIEPPPRVATEAAGFFLPSLLVVVGLALALFEIGRERTEPQFLQKSAILRERRFSTSAKSLRHGRARAFLGHLELDLREARFRNDEADLDVTAVCGRVDVLIPRGYEVKLKPPVGLAVRAIEPPSAGANDDDGGRRGSWTSHCPRAGILRMCRIQAALTASTRYGRSGCSARPVSSAG